MTNPLLLHPLVLFVAGNLVAISTAAFTKRDSALRYVAFVVCAALSWLGLSNFHIYIQTTGWSGQIFAAAVFTNPLVVLDRLLIRKWAFGHDFLGPIDLPDAEKKNQSRWEFGSDVSGSTRCIGSEKEVANVPYFSQENSQYVPSRPTFLLHHACLVVGMFYLNTFSIDIQLHTNRSLITKYHVPFLSRLPDVSIEEIFIRVQISIAYWVAIYSLLQLVYSLLAVISVSLKPQGLKFWRPMFGSIGSSYTVRGFWGKFWHQNIQLSLKGPAEFVTHSVLRIPPGTLAARYTKIFFAFSVSGLLHVASDSGGAVPIAQSGALWFFCTQALGIIIEDGVQEVYRILFGTHESRAFTAIGYLWVVVFISWSTPMWVYPLARTIEREDMLPTVGALYPLVSAFF